jgi:hypothetical protein
MLKKIFAVVMFIMFMMTGMFCMYDISFAAAPLSFDMPETRAYLVPGVLVTPSKLGSKYYLAAKGGAPPYTLTVTGNAVSVAPHRTKKYTFDITPRQAGTAILTLRDSAGATITAPFVVSADPTDGFKASALPTTIDVNKIVMITVSGGAPPYSIDILSPSRFRVERLAEDSYRLTGVLAGGGTVMIKDSKGRSQSIVLNPEPIKIAGVKTVLLPAEMTDVSVTGGTAPFAIEKSSPVAVTMLSEGKYKIGSGTPGSFSFGVRDATGIRAALTFQVAAPLSVSLRKISKYVTVSKDPEKNRDTWLRQGEQVELVITGGLLPYTVTASPAGIVAITQTGSTQYLVGPVAAGSVTVLVRDVRGAEQKIPFVSELEAFRLELLNDDIYSWSRQPNATTLKIIGGTPPYRVFSDWYRVKITAQSVGVYSIAGKGLSGDDQIVVEDGRDNRLRKNIKIRPSLAVQCPARTIARNAMAEVKIFDTARPLKVEVVQNPHLVKAEGVSKPGGLAPRKGDPLEIHFFRAIGPGTVKITVSDNTPAVESCVFEAR